jgi:hypothetical protein
MEHPDRPDRSGIGECGRILLQSEGGEQYVSCCQSLRGIAADSLDRVWRWVLILSFSSCYIMWGTCLTIYDLSRSIKTDHHIAITFLAQWHPLIQPRMTGLRKGYAGGS